MLNITATTAAGSKQVCVHKSGQSTLFFANIITAQLIVWSFSVNLIGAWTIIDLRKTCNQIKFKACKLLIYSSICLLYFAPFYRSSVRCLVFMSCRSVWPQMCQAINWFQFSVLLTTSHTFHFVFLLFKLNSNDVEFPCLDSRFNQILSITFSCFKINK